MPIDDSVLEGSADVIPDRLRGQRQTERPPSDADIRGEPPPVHNVAYPSDPGTILRRLDEWAAWHDELTEGYGTAVVALADAESTVEVAENRLAEAEADARTAAKRKPSQDRRTVADIDADVTIDDDVKAARRAVEDAHATRRTAKARVQRLYKLLDNADLNIGRLRSHAATARTLDPRGP